MVQRWNNLYLYEPVYFTVPSSKALISASHCYIHTCKARAKPGIWEEVSVSSSRKIKTLKRKVECGRGKGNQHFRIWLTRKQGQGWKITATSAELSQWSHPGKSRELPTEYQASPNSETNEKTEKEWSLCEYHPTLRNLLLCFVNSIWKSSGYV